MPRRDEAGKSADVPSTYFLEFLITKGASDGYSGSPLPVGGCPLHYQMVRAVSL